MAVHQPPLDYAKSGSEVDYGIPARCHSLPDDILNEPVVFESGELTEEEEFLVELAQKGPIETTARLEETAKSLALVVAASASAFVVALVLGDWTPQATSLALLAPMVLWWISGVAFLCVLSPRRYTVNGTSRNELMNWV